MRLQVGQKAKEIMDSGGLVTDEIVIGIIKDEIEKEGINVLQCVAVCCSVLQ